MKKFVLLVVAFLMANALFAGPFGLKMGMTLEEIKEKCGWSNVVHISNDVYDIKPPKPSSFFKHSYVAFVDDTFGLYIIGGLGTPMSYGDCLVILNGLANHLENYYGKPQTTEKLKDITSVHMTFNPDAVVTYRWKLPECKKLEKEKVSKVVAFIDELNQDVGMVRVQYSFNNCEKVIENATPF